MPADLVARLNAATNEVLAQPEIKKRLLELGVTTTPGTPADFTTFVRNQVDDAAAGRQDRPRHALIEASRAARDATDRSTLNA